MWESDAPDYSKKFSRVVFLDFSFCLISLCFACFKLFFAFSSLVLAMRSLRVQSKDHGLENWLSPFCGRTAMLDWRKTFIKFVCFWEVLEFYIWHQYIFSRGFIPVTYRNLFSFCFSIFFMFWPFMNYFLNFSHFCLRSAASLLRFDFVKQIDGLKKNKLVWRTLYFQRLLDVHQKLPKNGFFGLFSKIWKSSENQFGRHQKRSTNFSF